MSLFNARYAPIHFVRHSSKLIFVSSKTLEGFSSSPYQVIIGSPEIGASNEIQVYVLLATNLLLLLAVARRAERSHVALGLAQTRHSQGILNTKIIRRVST